MKRLHWLAHPNRNPMRISLNRTFLLAFTLLALAGCAQNPVSGQNDFVMMSESQEVAIGRQYDAQIKKEYRVYESKALNDYVNSVGQRLARSSHRPNLQYHFIVLDSPEINAFSLPGGYVYITRGILAYMNSEADLAAVLGHELGHITARHAVLRQSAAQAASIGLTIASHYIPGLNTIGGQNLSNIIGGALLSGYGREQELEADRLGAEYLARNGYDPQAIIRVIDTLKNQEAQDAQIARQEGREPRSYHGLFATHPDNDTRLQQAVGESRRLTVAHPVEGRNEFLAAIDGLVFNESSDQGVVRNNHFYHGELGVAVTFPENWQVHNLPDVLVAISPGGEAQLQLKLDRQPSGSPTEYARRAAGYGAQIQPIEVNNLQGALIDLPNVVAGVIYLNRQAYILEGQAKDRASLAAHRAEIVSSVRSFHALTAEERKLVKPLVIRVITVRQGDTWARLAQYSPLGKSAESYLRLINAMYPSGEPRAGQRIKIVE
ncbi:MAG TPA: M48 family metalloprotease [Gallionella sp.]|nr:M48 family metalloprotease [Gallionella sp.]